MQNLEELKSNEKNFFENKNKIELLINSLKSINFVKRFFRKAKIKRLNKKLDFFNETHLNNCKLYLEKNDNEYIKLVNQNYELLESDLSIFKITSLGSNMYKSNALFFEGKIHHNGFIYLQTTETIFSGSGAYPKTIYGKIDYLGNTQMRAGEIGIVIFGDKIPYKYNTKISKNGEIKLTSNDNYRTLGDCFILKMICDPFCGDNQKRELFLENRIVLKQIILKFRTELLNK